MNCHEFESTLDDIARGSLRDAGAGEAHAAACQPCAARLADARSLYEGLRALSTEAAGACAPPRVEANLLTAFRAQTAQTAGAAHVAAGAGQAPVAFVPPVAAPIVVPFVSKKWSWPKTFGAAGLAAAAAVVFVLLVPSIFSGPRQPPPPTLQADTRQPPPKTNVEQPSEGRIIVPPDVLDVHEASVKAPDVALDREPATTATVRPPRAPRGGATMTSVKYGGGGGGARNVGGTTDAAAYGGERAEITTDFIPLAHGGGFAAGDGAHVVRVELPHTALERFGLPFNAERSGGRVKADVLLGQDGVARAIRFVR
ncbi:MAG TPA: hypothetical protein VF064_16575 [Pyrinomonadaceae bacterium]